MRYTLRQLEVFLATAHYENVSHAADSLAMSQSAASTSLKEFEQRFGVQLFDRIGKKVQLNEQGHSIRSRAQALVDQASELEQSLFQHSDIGNLKVGATLTIGNYLAVPIMAKFMAQHKEARVALTVENTAAIAERVKKFELDIGLIEGELQDPQIEVLPWRDDELSLFCAPDHPLAKQTILGDEELVKAQWIVREFGSGTRQAFDRAMRGLLPQLNLRLELQHTEAIKRAVEAKLGIGCLSKITLEEAFIRGNLVPLSAPQRDWHRNFYFILHKQKYHSAAIQTWLELCREF